MNNEFIAYSDEAYKQHKYQSISVISFPRDCHAIFTEELKAILLDSSLREFKWKELDDARYRFGAEKLIDWAIRKTDAKQLKIDTIIWDMSDSRHNNISQIDRAANLGRMYYHLLQNVLQERWLKNSYWYLYPDENTELTWNLLQEFLNYKGKVKDKTKSFLPIIQNYEVKVLTQVSSIQNPLCQIADLFAGLGAFSYNYSHIFEKWLEEESPQLALNLKFENTQNITVSKKQKEKCYILDYLLKKASYIKTGSKKGLPKGLHTFKNNTPPINFWLYIPQTSIDKAPRK